MDEYNSVYEVKHIPLVIVQEKALREFTRQLLGRTTLPPEDADTLTDALMASELRNLQGQGQGVRRVRAYVERIEMGYIDTQAQFEIVRESPALALVDGHNGPGTIVAAKAMRLATDKAKECGIGMVLVRHSSHFGSASYSASQALDSGCIGVSITNAGPEMAPWGGIDAVVGTNPWAVAVPTGSSRDSMPIILDMALTMAGKGMMRWLMRDGRKMPYTWAITKDGRNTDNPAEAMDGTLLPMGDYKGYGFSFITDILTGVLSGGAYGTVPYSNPARQDVAHQFIAYDIDWFIDRNEFYRNLQDFISMVKSSRVRPGVEEIWLPGEIEWRREQEKRRNGIPLDPEIYSELRELASELDVKWPF